VSNLSLSRVPFPRDELLPLATVEESGLTISICTGQPEANQIQQQYEQGEACNDRATSHLGQ
jgi:hypothetical protein